MIEWGQAFTTQLPASITQDELNEVFEHMEQIVESAFEEALANKQVPQDASYELKVSSREVGTWFTPEGDPIPNVIKTTFILGLVPDWTFIPDYIDYTVAWYYSDENATEPASSPVRLIEGVTPHTVKVILEEYT
jgi:hypothetical protein